MSAPDPFRDTFLAYVAAESVVAGVRVGLFDALAEGPAPASDLAERLGLDPLGTDALLVALEPLGYVEREGERWGATPEAARLLSRSSPDSIATFVESSQEMHREALAALATTLRGGPGRNWHASDPDHPMWEPYLRGLWELSRGEHTENAAALGLSAPQTLLDIAGGHGGFAMAMCERHPGLVATVLDLPAGARVGRAIVAEQGFGERIVFQEGDALSADLGDGWDVISVFNLVHHLTVGDCAALVRRAAAALAPGGVLVIGDTERPEGGAGASEIGAITGVVHYALSRGRTYSVAEIEGWLREAGLEEIQTAHNPASPWRVLVSGQVAPNRKATKPG